MTVEEARIAAERRAVRRAAMLQQDVFQRHASWAPLTAELEPGYTVLVTYPGDLPGLLQLSLRTLAAVDNSHCREILVIPDSLDSDDAGPDSDVLVAPSLVDRLACVVRKVPLTPAEKLVLRQNPGNSVRHWAQIVAGLHEVRTRYALLHDADLVFEDPGFPAAHFRAAQDEKLACRGAETVWDSWFAANGHGHVVGTWEMMLDVEWVRTFAPTELRPQRKLLDGVEHEFDTLLWAQATTSPTQIACAPYTSSFQHFGHLVCTFRDFQKRDPDAPFHDEHALLVVMRILHDVLGAPASDDLPSFEALVSALSSDSRYLTFPRNGEQPGPRRSMRVLRRVADLVFSTSEREQMSVLLTPFAKAFEG